MTVIVCVSDGGGIAFNNRRQSKDRALISDVLSDFADKKIYVSDYSAPLFKDAEVTVCNKISDLEDNCVYFVERQTPREYLDKISTLVLYRWNRKYPADVYLDIDPEQCGFKLASVKELEGSSHERITREVYVK